MKICMLVRNPISQDPRVLREAETLLRAGNDLTILGLTAAGLPRVELWRGLRLVRLPRLGERSLRLPRAALARWRARQASAATPVEVARPGAALPAPRTPEVSTPARPTLRSRLGAALARFGGELAEANFLANAVAAGLGVRADVYHAHDLDTLEAARLCAGLRGAKLVYDSHELFVDWQANKVGAPPWRVRRLAAQERRGASVADLVITVSDGIADELVRLYGIRRPLVVRNCPPLQPLRPGQLLRQQIGGEAGRPIVLYQGGFTSGRGLPELVEAAARLPEVDFVLLGPDSPLRRRLVERAAGAGAANVFFPPRVPLAELFAYTCSASLGVVLTQPVCRSYELSLGNKVFEYLMAGLPVLASAIESHRLLADETGALLLSDPTDPAALAEAIGALVRDPARLQQMSGRARDWAERKYSSEQEMARLSAAYRAL